MLNLLCEADSAILCGDIINLRLLFEVYANCCEQLLPFIQDENLYEVFCQTIEANQQQQAELSNGCLNLNSIDGFFVQASNGLNDSFNQSMPIPM